MIMNGNPENSAGLGKLMSNCEVFLAWFRVSTGVIVEEDDAGCALFDRFRKTLPGMYKG